jgi:hypothetical protein
MSQTYIAQIPYSTYYSALVADSKTTNDTIALAHVPGGATDPVHGGANVTATLPNLRALGITVNSTTNYDSIVYFNNQPGLFNYTRPPVDPNAYDLQATITHELDEVLGTSSGVGQTYIHPPDLFRYTAAHARTFTTAGDDAWFSIDAANNLVQYNQDAGGDYGDWWSVTTPAVPRVQDAFATQGATPDLAEELLVLDVIGWDLAAAVPQLVTAPAAVVHASKSGNTLNLSWASVTNRNYQVQMRTNLTAGAWANLGSPILATTTTTTYSDTPLSDKTRFYRVVSLPSNPPSPPPAFAAAGQIVTGPFELSTHVLNPRPGAAPAPPQGNLKRFGPINLASPEAIQGNRVDN